MPAEFQRRLNVHNRQCWVAAAVSLLGAWLGWLFFGVIFTGAVLVFEAVRTGSVDLLKPPVWFYPAGVAGVILLFLWAGLDRWIHRFHPPPDRPIIGWHLIRDVLFLPARMTFAIWEHLGARVVLGRHERMEAWRLLLAIRTMERPSAALLAAEFPDTRLLMKLLVALQLLGWIDLHGGDGEWYYKICSSGEEDLRALLGETREEDVER